MRVQYLAGDERPDLGHDVVVANERGTRPPVVQVLTWLSEADTVQNVLRTLGPDQPVYLICPPEHDDAMDYPRTVDAWVEHAEERLAGLDLPDDLVYFGWSFGGLVALEIAQRRWDSGRLPHRPEVVMLDTRNPENRRQRPKAVSRSHSAARLVTDALERPWNERLAFIRHRWRDNRTLAEQAATPKGDMPPLRRAIFVAWIKYETRLYDVDATLLWCDDSRTRLDDVTLGWGRYWRADLRTGRLSDGHFTVYDESNVPLVAGAVADAVQRTRSRAQVTRT